MSIATEDVASIDVNCYEDVQNLPLLVKNLSIGLNSDRKKIINSINDEQPKVERDVLSSCNSKSEEKTPIANGYTNYSNLKSDQPPDVKSNGKDDDLIDVDDIELSDEDSWLFTSPKELSSEERSVSSYKWLRKDVDDLENVRLQMARTALVNKLEELAILSPAVEDRDHVEVQRFRASSLPTFKPLQESPLKINSQTYTRQKKKKSSCIKDLNTAEPVQDSKENEIVHATEKTSPSASQQNRIFNVYEIARLQEESLRQNSSSGIARRNSAASCDGQPVKQTNHFNHGESHGRLAKQSLNGVCDSINIQQANRLECCNNSAHSSPPDSPYSSSISLDCLKDNHRSSLPNLAKGYNSLKKKGQTKSNNSQFPLPAHPGTSLLRQPRYSTLPAPVRKSSFSSTLNKKSSLTSSEESLQSSRLPEPVSSMSLGKHDSNSSLHRYSVGSSLQRNSSHPQKALFPHKELPESGARNLPNYKSSQEQCDFNCADVPSAALTQHKTVQKSTSLPVSQKQSSIEIPQKQFLKSRFPSEPSSYGSEITFAPQPRRCSVPLQSSHKESQPMDNCLNGTSGIKLQSSTPRRNSSPSHSRSQLSPDSVHNGERLLSLPTAVSLQKISKSGSVAKEIEKSGLPKPSKLPAPKARSGIPVPSSAGAKQVDIWSQGCF